MQFCIHYKDALLKSGVTLQIPNTLILTLPQKRQIVGTKGMSDTQRFRINLGGVLSDPNKQVYRIMNFSYTLLQDIKSVHVRACLRPGMCYILVLMELQHICGTDTQGDKSLLDVWAEMRRKLSSHSA